MKRPIPILLVIIAAVSLPSALAVFLSLAPDPLPAQQDFADNPYEEAIIDAETGRDVPRAIENPQYISMADAGLTLEPQDVVFVIDEKHAGGRTAILPQRIMVHHEIANLEFEDRKAVVVYSPLCGMVRGFAGRVDGRAGGFGTTGKYVNSMRLIYDRVTDSLWLPLTGRALDGPMTGAVLESFPVEWTTWEKVQAAYPQARVLSGGALVDADYTRDPYGSYLRDNTYYQMGGSYLPLLNTDQRLKPKDAVIVPASGEPTIAFPLEAASARKVVNFERGMTRIVSFYNPELGVLNLFEPEATGRELTFGYSDGKIFDHQTRSRWSPDGEAVEGRLRGRTLPRVESMRIYWFAWAAFHPESFLATEDADQ